MATIPMTERAGYVQLATEEADRLSAKADEAADYGFHDEALKLRMDASELYDRAAQARESLGADGLLLR